MQTLASAAHALATGQTTARALVEQCLAAIADPAGEGGQTFRVVYDKQARAAADAMDALRQVNRHPGPYAGVPFSLKDLFDVAGEVTCAGSVVLADAPPAATTAPVVQRMMDAGFVAMGRTNMSEFAFSGVGINPHYGTPASPWRRAERHIPGGSSAGAAVSVADGMALVALGTDTGGSCRIPAALCGIVGYKPTASAVPTRGAFPLSTTLDSIGPLGASVACCATVHALLAGETPVPLEPMVLRGLRVAVPGNLVMDGLDPAVAEAFGRILTRLSTFGARITHLPLPQLDAIVAANAGGGFSPPEAYAYHQTLLERAAGQYDQRVRMRIERGAGMSAAAYITLLAERVRIIAAFDAATAPFDVVAMPTVAILPPRIDSLTEDAEFLRVNGMLLRNPSLANFLNRCSISLPAHRDGDAPVGFMLMGPHGTDQRLLQIAAAAEGLR